MAAKRRSRRKKRIIKRLIWTLIVLIVAIVGFFVGKYAIDEANKADPVSGGEIEFHFIDVGQADAALIRTEAGDILIDAGCMASEDELKAYLDSQGVEDIEYAVFTHPHEDHIGGAEMVMKTYDVKNVILPDYDHDTKLYGRVLAAIESSGAQTIIATPGDEFEVGELSCTILSPIGDAGNNPNNASVTIRAEYGETSVLFTGDAEVKSEKEMIQKFGRTGELDCDLIKVGHHGSDTSSSIEFLQAVTPDFAVISCGEGNKHGHPVPDILTRYLNMDIEVIRTDKEGTIVFTSTGGEPEREAA